MNEESPNPTVKTSKESESSQPSWFGILLRVLLPIVFLGVGIAAYYFFSREEPKAARPRPKPKPIEVEVLELKREDFQIQVATHGLIQAHSQVNLTAQVAGRVQAIHPGFDNGALFKKDQILLELDPVDFEEALVNARAQLAQAQFNLQQENVRAKQARLNWEDLGYDEKPNEMVLRLPHVKLAESQLKRAEEQLVSARRNLDRTKVRAPFDGRVLSRSAGVGQTIGAGTALGVIFATDFSEVRLPVSTRFLADLTLPEDITDPPIDIQMKDGLAEGSEVTWPAKILRTEGALDANTLELFAVARVEDPFGLQTGRTPLRIGQPVTSAIPGRILKDVFVIPREAVTDLKRIRLVDPDKLTLGTAIIDQLWGNEDFLVFRDPKIEDGTLLVRTRIFWAPDGGKVVIVEDSPLEGEAGAEKEKPRKGGSSQ